MRRKLLRVSVVLSGLISPSATSAADLCLVGWNLESGGSAQTRLNEVASRNADCDIWGLSEVAGPDVLAGLADAISKASGRKLDWVMSNTSRTGPSGAADFQGLVYDSSRLVLERIEEMYELSLGGGRGPLLGYFRFQQGDGKPFIAMVNHLHRGNAAKRLQQAKMLNAWVSNVHTPVVAIGDYNVDWTLPDGRDRHPSFDALVAGGHFQWIKPSPLIPTTCYEPKPGILDLVLAGGEARSWTAISTVLEPNGYCPDGPEGSDHRPVKAIFRIP